MENKVKSVGENKLLKKNWLNYTIDNFYNSNFGLGTSFTVIKTNSADRVVFSDSDPHLLKNTRIRNTGYR